MRKQSGGIVSQLFGSIFGRQDAGPEEAQRGPAEFNDPDDDGADSLLQEFADSAIDFTETTQKVGNDLPTGIARLVDLMFQEARLLRATEIQLSAHDDRIDIRYLIDGKLNDRDHPPRRWWTAILSRLRELARISDQETTAEFVWTSDAGDQITIDLEIRSSDVVVLKLQPVAATASAAGKKSPNKFWT